LLLVVIVDFREVEQFAERLLEGSYGRRNRHPRDAGSAQLRAVEQAYRTALERDAAIGPPEPAEVLRSSRYEAAREIELEYWVINYVRYA
jgi:hypothetical protein